MSGNINQHFNLKQADINLEIKNGKQNNSPILKHIVYCNSTSKDEYKMNCSDRTNIQKDFKCSTPASCNRSPLDTLYYSSDSDDSDKCCILQKKTTKSKKLPPIGVFWDIENCQVPKGRSAVSVAQLIRDSFFGGYREAEFLVACDVKKESTQVIQELNDAQVTLIHVASTCKNAADEKLRQALRRFADTYYAPAAVILISGDINFAADLSDLRHRKKLHVILIHKENAADALILCATEHYSYTTIINTLPVKEIKLSANTEAMDVIVRNIPQEFNPLQIRKRLKQLSDNCGGRVVAVSLKTSTAVVRFNNLDVAVRAQRRMDGEDVYGNKISVSYPNSVRHLDKSYSPYKFPPRRVMKNPDMFMHPVMYGVHPAAMRYPHPVMDYYIPNSLPNMSQNTGAIPKRMQQDNFSYCHNEQFQQKRPEMFQQYYRPSKPVPSCSQTQLQMPEFARGVRVVHNATNITDFPKPENWRPHSASFSEGQKRNRMNDSSFSNKPNWCRNVSGSFTALNVLENEENESFQADNCLRRSNSLTNTSNSSSYVELLVTNIDQTIDPQELKSILLSLFKEHAMVLSLVLFHQSDGNLAASVRVSSAQDAQYVISQLHRRKVGNKRVLISNAQSTPNNPHILRSQVVALLQEVPGNRMPLFKFRELLESRYRNSVSVSELYKLRDVCNVKDEFGGRMVTLSSDLRTTTSPHLDSQTGLEMLYCVTHCPNGLNERGWADPATPALPNVRFQLKLFTTKVHALLHSHSGTLPLLSFPMCYECENGEKMPIDDSGVPLEHLITCVVGVELRLNNNMVKYIIWSNQMKTEKYSEENSSSNSLNSTVKPVSPPLANQLASLTKELIDLLKTTPHCQLPFSRFIPAYHHLFGRQCRVADYGYTKLVDLFDALSQIIQIIGEGNERIITLSHSAQIRRFTNDLLRVLRSQASKQITLSEFPIAYERVMSRQFDPVDYGLCELTDLLNEVSENTVVIKHNADDILIVFPKREQTSEEIRRMKIFTIEVVDLLRHTPYYSMFFNKFVPAYHHHFGHQCRVSDYGFTKLIELFEAIPDTVKIEEASCGERRVSLTAKEALKVVKEQIVSLVQSSFLLIPLVALPSIFRKEYGYELRPEVYECSSHEELISRLSDSLQLTSGPAGQMLSIIEKSTFHQLGIRIWALLINPPHKLPASILLQNYQSKYGYMCTLQQLEKYCSIIEISVLANDEKEISLTPMYVLAARLYHLLYENGGAILMGNIDALYMRKYGHVLRPAEYDARNLKVLLSQMTFFVSVKGKRNKRHISLNPSITSLDIPVPTNMKYNDNGSGSSERSQGIVQWPPPPTHTFLYNSLKTALTPPKPDTPPTLGNNHWIYSPNFTSPLNLRIQLPPLRRPSIFDNSPMRFMAPGCSYDPFDNAPLFTIQAPDPSELPMPPAELLNKGNIASPFKDSGISGNSFSNSLEEPDSSTNFETENVTPTKKKR